MVYPDISTRLQRPNLAPMLKRVESMGISCELGFVQRHCHANGLSLLRFAHSPIEGLLAALETEFSAFTEPDRLLLKVAPSGEWMCVIRDYWFEFHTTKFAAVAAEDEVRAYMVAQLGLLTRVFMETLRDGEKIFVYRPRTPRAAGARALALRDAMHRFGRPVLLWLDVARHPDQIGTVEWTEKGSLMTGYIDRYADPAPTLSFDIWLRVIKAAVQLRDAT